MTGTPPSRSSPDAPPDDEDVYAVAVLGLPEMTGARLRMLRAHYATWSGVARAVERGSAGRLVIDRAPPERRAQVADTVAHWPAGLDIGSVRALVARRGTRVWHAGRDDFPILDDLPDRPVVLVSEGSRVDALERARVAIVGTRSATPHGLADAAELAGTLADAGVTVVSGLALGIDGAAHRGALEAGGVTIAVVATGLDIVYPRRHAPLDARIRADGLVMGETGYGVGPHAWRFPVRNRIIAALADVVVVVEATSAGGARITAEHALRYDRAVFAVPGSRRNVAAAGTNALIADGAHPLTDWGDLLLALGMTPGARRATPVRPAPDHEGRALLDALGGEPASPEELAARTGRAPEQIALLVRALERDGWLNWTRGLVWPC